MKQITVLLVQASEKPQIVKCESEFEAFDKLLGQETEVHHYLPGAVALIAKKRRNAQKLTLTRAIFSEGNFVDVVVGPFILAFDPEYDCNFQSLPLGELLDYYASFFCPEIIEFDNNMVIVSRYDPVSGTTWYRNE